MATLGTGTSITFGTSSFSGEWLNVDGSGNLAREDINVSHLETSGSHKYLPSSLVEGGEFSGQIHFDGSESVPYDSAAETITINWGGETGTGNAWSFDGYVKEYTPSAPMEDRMTANVTIKVAGAITGGGL